MTNAWALLFGSRKFWTATLTVLAVLGAVVLRALDKIPADALLPTIGALTSTGLGLVGAIAWEDAAAKSAGSLRPKTAKEPAAAAMDTPPIVVDQD